MAIRKVLRLPAVLDATGWAKPTLYRKISEGKFPAGRKLDPDARAIVWFEDEVEAFQRAAVSATEATA
ncbi:helix-turn-helix transcriptional regulator [Bradyrhizobium uaiense]|uniref:AlpA family phage regulatory protein n=1 Tax=Bradyrhizobium uaiense TaxID=2594946 RepID=A0A6P1B8B8_9BRAD|nr:AlpA family phage regulatory protein [Bradyrhizobium uaiense]NEU94787.1 AlpA family phage regulatory protein [Bradyrhizobium uaiense]